MRKHQQKKNKKLETKYEFKTKLHSQLEKTNLAYFRKVYTKIGIQE